MIQLVPVHNLKRLFMFHAWLYHLLYLVQQKQDFPFSDVPVPKVTYLDDGKEEVTLKCDFDVPTWGNVSFEIQWFVNGRGLGPAECDDPDNNKCSHLGTTDYKLGDRVV